MTGMAYVPRVADRQAATKEVRLVFFFLLRALKRCWGAGGGGREARGRGVFVSQWKT